MFLILLLLFFFTEKQQENPLMFPFLFNLPSKKVFIQIFKLFYWKTFFVERNKKGKKTLGFLKQICVRFNAST